MKAIIVSGWGRKGPDRSRQRSLPTKEVPMEVTPTERGLSRFPIARRISRCHFPTRGRRVPEIQTKPLPWALRQWTYQGSGRSTKTRMKDARETASFPLHLKFTVSREHVARKSPRTPWTGSFIGWLIHPRSPRGINLLKGNWRMQGNPHLPHGLPASEQTLNWWTHPAHNTNKRGQRDMLKVPRSLRYEGHDTVSSRELACDSQWKLTTFTRKTCYELKIWRHNNLAVVYGTSQLFCSVDSIPTSTAVSQLWRHRETRSRL